MCQRCPTVLSLRSLRHVRQFVECHALRFLVNVCVVRADGCRVVADNVPPDHVTDSGVFKRLVAVCRKQ